MVRIKNEHDLETLRQITLLVDNENQRLVNENVRLRVELARLHGVPETEQLELSVLKQLQEKRESIFRIDEKRTRKKTKAKKNKKKGHGPREQPHLPVVDKVIELAETEKKCSVCDGEMAGQYEESEVVTVVKRSFVIERHLRKKYRCRCNANVVTAPAATKLQPGGRYSVEFATEVAISKYLDHMPLERQVRMMRREGLDIDSQTLWDQLNVLARHLNPVYDALGEKVLESPVIHADETRWPLMGSMKKSAGTVWGVSSPDIAYYRMLPTKSTEDGQKVLGTYSGIAVVDGYAVYEVLARAGPDGYAARAGPQFRLTHCWAHVKRKFDEASEHYPQACSEVLRLIGELYEVEREVERHENGCQGDESPPAVEHETRAERQRAGDQEVVRPRLGNDFGRPGADQIRNGRVEQRQGKPRPEFDGDASEENEQAGSQHPQSSPAFPTEGTIQAEPGEKTEGEVRHQEKFDGHSERGHPGCHHRFQRSVIAEGQQNTERGQPVEPNATRPGGHGEDEERRSKIEAQQVWTPGGELSLSPRADVGHRVHVAEEVRQHRLEQQDRPGRPSERDPVRKPDRARGAFDEGVCSKQGGRCEECCHQQRSRQAQHFSGARTLG